MERKDLLSKSNCNNGEDSDNNDDNILAKIKRLQIEENYIRQSLCKSIVSNNNGVNLLNDFNDSNYHRFTINMKDSFSNIKQMYQYVKTNTINQVTLKTVDVDEIKMTILELEDKIKSLKKNLQRELANLKRSEELLKQDVLENPVTLRKIKGRQKVHFITYNQIVPSPVKEIINSSFKCLEVQEFQEFMANSTNRCGGWNEYYHNLFIKTWKKYFKVDCNVDFEIYVSNIMSSKEFQLMLPELLLKLTGFTTENIKTHCQWYLKYSYLKERQRIAIEKWRQKKHLIKSKTEVDENCVAQKPTKDYSHDRDVAENGSKLSSMSKARRNRLKIEGINKSINEGYSGIINSSCRNRIPCTYKKPTKQWISRCQDLNKYSTSCNNDPANIRKLQIPKWRLRLQDEV